MRTFLIFLLLISCSAVASAKKLNFETGDEFAVKTNGIETTPQQTKHEEYTFLLKVLSADNDTYKLQCNLARFKLNLNGGYYTTSINTDSIRKTDFNSDAMLAQLILLQKDFKVTVNSKGVILNIEGYDELLQQAIAKWHLSVRAQSGVQNNTQVFITNTFKKIFFELPENAIAPKLSWNKYAVDYVVERKQGNLFYISASNALKSFTGEYVIDAEKGMPLKATFSQKNPKGLVVVTSNYSQIVSKGKASINPVDTAWLNMAMSMSFMSDRFKNSSGDSDSAKVFGYLAAHNKTFKNDAYYIKNRLSIIQTVRTPSADLLYDSLLSITPNHILAGSISALHNKSHRALQNSADSAYGVIKYFYKDRSFNDWVQYSYSQAFMARVDLNEKSMIDEMRKEGLSENEINKTIANTRRFNENSRVLLDKLHNDPTPLIQQKIKALYLWVNAGKNVNNVQVLSSIATQFVKLDDDYMKEGNGGRYGLLLYKTFTEAGQKQNANLVLQKVINDLTRYQADTLYADRNVTRSLLAHAYYLSYQDALATDSVKALDYLSKAALYSPSSAKEKAYGSFYDRAFLNSQESYADDYIKKLFDKGDSEDALAVFAKYISSDLGHLSEAQARYEKLFPGKSFKAFFADKVVSGWANAPAFTLKGADDSKEYTLASYKGKWLLTDFWGTWCSPCREEMPQINKFNNALMNGELAGWAFLSIACRDSRVAVNKYLAENKYTIPVAMADEKITGNYKIDGYPSKILISPTGKMISTSSGADWRAIIAKVNELYPAQ